MKNNWKNKWLVALLLCAYAVLCVFPLAGAEGADYSEWDYFQFTELTDEDWDAKTISYQFLGGDPNDPASFGEYDKLHGLVLINLYEDGTVCYWQAGHYFTDGMPEECICSPT